MRQNDSRVPLSFTVRPSIGKSKPARHTKERLKRYVHLCDRKYLLRSPKPNKFAICLRKSYTTALTNECTPWLDSQTTDIAKLVSEAWREIDPEEKAKWEAEAQKDKARYDVEKAMYKGPWKVLANRRATKDPTAPKRPMSAFLSYSNRLRAALKKQNPNATNSDLSKMLSVTWKGLSDKEKKKYLDEEAELRAKYKIEMAKWRQQHDEEKRLVRMEREAIASKTAEAQAQARPAMEQAAALQQQALEQQQASMSAATIQQQLMVTATQLPTDEDQSGDSTTHPPGQSLTEAELAEDPNQQGQSSQIAAHGMFGMNMGLPGASHLGMPVNPGMMASNPYLAQQFQQQMQLQQLLGTCVDLLTAEVFLKIHCLTFTSFLSFLPSAQQQYMNAGMYGQNMPNQTLAGGQANASALAGQNPQQLQMQFQNMQQQQMQIQGLLQGQMNVMGGQPGNTELHQQLLQQTQTGTIDPTYNGMLNFSGQPPMQQGQSGDREEQHEEHLQQEQQTQVQAPVDNMQDYDSHEV
jgi:hypothetical protein